MNTTKIKLPNGLYLTAEKSSDPAYPYEIFVGITDENGAWIQDLVIIGHDYHFENDGGYKPVWDEGLHVYVYGNENDEDYTEEFNIGFWKDEDDV